MQRKLKKNNCYSYWYYSMNRTSTAEILFENTELGTHACKQSISLTNGKSYVFSARQANSVMHLFLDIYDTSFATKAQSFDLTTVTSADATGSPAQIIAIIDIGDGKCHCLSGVCTFYKFSLLKSDCQKMVTGVAINILALVKVCMFGKQLGKGSVLTDYTPSVETSASPVHLLQRMWMMRLG